MPELADEELGGAMRDDGLFYGAEETPFEYLWESSGGQSRAAYRLQRVTSTPGIFDVPVNQDRQVNLVPSEMPGEAIIVGERGGGLESFQDWLIHRETRSKWAILQPEELVRVLDRFETVILDCTRPAAVAEQRAPSMARIATHLESLEWSLSKRKIIVITHEIASLRTDDTIFSSILSRSHAYRLPHFDASGELEQWVEELLRKRKLLTKVREEGPEIARSIKQLIGGQPTLTHLLFRRVDDRWEKSGVAPPTDAKELWEAFEEEALYLEENPPHLVRRWAQDLQALLARADVLRRFEGYAFGDTKGPFDLVRGTGAHCDRVDADLFMAGWVGLDAAGVWGMRSDCHRRWAKEILREGSQ